MREDMTLQHDTAVFKVLREDFPKTALTRGIITKVTNLPRSTVYDALMRLEHSGMITSLTMRELTISRGEPWRNTPGRPKVLWCVLESL